MVLRAIPYLDEISTVFSPNSSICFPGKLSSAIVMLKNDTLTHVNGYLTWIKKK
jgi:hypothetical protein